MASDQSFAAPATAPATIPPHVVVVDDDPLFLRTFTANMENAGYRVTAFKKPSDALANMLNAEPPAACILDWHMPEMDGLDMLRKLKAGEFSAPVMFLTGLNQPMFEE